MSLYDVIVVGGGHAGMEAALVSARLSMKTLLITQSVERISFMSCNPSIGGLGKGHMVREIDILGGRMGRAADHSCIQFKRLNSSKGPAVRGSRMQCDKDVYSEYMSSVALNTDNLCVVEGEVRSLILENQTCSGVVTTEGVSIRSKTVVIATGTFMRGIMYLGMERIEGGRVGDKATIGISDQLAEHGFKVTRLKTGTPPRLDKRTIDWSQTTSQSGDDFFVPFSFKSHLQPKLPQIDCFLTYTNEKTHEVIRRNLDQSPLFSGIIEGIGPRYCPSIEDKVTRFKDKANHLSFLEPEGLNSRSIYLQGLSTSLPENIQYEFLRTIPGLQNVKILRPGYAVEYDFFEPTQIFHNLETKNISHLFFAGQINGSSGYEEAAGQGLVAGINAALKVKNQSEFVLGRDESYIGILIDDLVTKGTKEPYRMLTSRAEYRLVLREDNVFERLYNIAKDYCLLSGEDLSLIEKCLKARQDFYRDLASKKLVPSPPTQKALKDLGTSVLQKPITFEELLRRNEISCLDLGHLGLTIPKDRKVYEPVEIAVKYSGYIQRQEKLISQARKLEKLVLPPDMLFEKIRGLSNEEVEKLEQIKPRTLGQAQRISGVNPSAIQALLVHMKAMGRWENRRDR